MTCRKERVRVPTRAQLERKAAGLRKLAAQPVTEADIARMLERKRADVPSARAAMLERARLHQALELARARNERVEVADLEAQLAQLAGPADAPAVGPEDALQARLREVDERNRRASAEAARRAEIERKRARRKLEAERAAVSTPDAVASRPGTPAAKNGVPAEKPAALPPSALGLSGNAADKVAQEADSLEKSVLEEVDLDLGDFF
jgi:hypothetical protein